MKETPVGVVAPCDMRDIVAPFDKDLSDGLAEISHTAKHYDRFVFWNRIQIRRKLRKREIARARNPADDQLIGLSQVDQRIL